MIFRTTDSFQNESDCPNYHSEFRRLECFWSSEIQQLPNPERIPLAARNISSLTPLLLLITQKIWLNSLKNTVIQAWETSENWNLLKALVVSTYWLSFPVFPDTGKRGAAKERTNSTKLEHQNILVPKNLRLFCYLKQMKTPTKPRQQGNNTHHLPSPNIQKTPINIKHTPWRC